MAQRVIAACGGSVQGKTIAVLGVTFKPETDDMRDAPSLVILPALAAAGAVVRAYDPQPAHAKQVLPAGVQWAENALDAAQGADALVLITEWNEFRAISPEKLKAAMAGNVVCDLRNVWDPAQMREEGFDYSSIGRA